MNVEAKVLSAIQKNLTKKHAVTLNSRLVDDLEVDSFDILMIIAGLEVEFSITIDEEDFKDVVTVSDIVEKIKAAVM